MPTSVLPRSALSAAAAALITLAAPVASQAQVATGRAFEFYGTCSDCTLNTAPGGPLAVLLLDFGYALGSPIGVADIIGFTYVGSNLVFPYAVTGGAFSQDESFMPDIYLATGAISANPGPQDFRVEFVDGQVFASTAQGAWYTCSTGPAGFYSGTCNLTANQDIGAGSWNQPVPEPATYGLMGLGLLGLAWAKRRQA